MTNIVPKVIADLELQLATTLAVGGTSFTLSASVDDDAVSIPAGLYCFTLDNGTSNKEYLIGQVNGTAVTAVKSVSRQGVETTGAVRKHRIGAPCILTDFATIQRVQAILTGDSPLDGSSPIIYDAEPTLADRKEVATVGYVLDIVSGGTVAFDAQTIAGNGGEAIVAGNLIYFKTSDQEWYLTDADTAATIEGVLLGIALGSGTNGVAISGGIQISGTYTTTGLTAGSLYYASNTAGAIATSAGTTSQIVGLALSTTKLLLIPRNPQTVTTKEKAAMAGGGDFGTPSTTNKYITQDYNASASGIAQIVPFTASGTWTKDAGLKYVIVEVIGGGGAGGGGVDSTDDRCGHGGGGGGYSRKIIAAASLGATETVTVGAGGTAVGGGTGNTGGTTSFGAHLQATGGTGGTTSNNDVSGVGGIGSSGDVNSAGDCGESAEPTKGSSSQKSGAGGGTYMGGGGLGVGANTAGESGRAYGGGGSGGKGSSGSSPAGGAGAPGVVIVTEYYS